MLVRGLYLVSLISKIMSDGDTSFAIPASVLVINWTLGNLGSIETAGIFLCAQPLF